MKKINSLFKMIVIVILMMTPMVFQAKNHDVKSMAKRIDKVYIAATPEILEVKGNMVTVTIDQTMEPFHISALIMKVMQSSMHHPVTLCIVLNRL